MIFSKRSITFSTFLLLSANHVAAKTIRKLGNTRGSQYINDHVTQATTEEWADFDARQLQLSMPSTPGPTPRPTRRPTSRPNSQPTAPPAPTTQAPTPQPTPQPTNPPTPQPTPQPTPPPTNAAFPTIPALFLDEDDLFDEFGLSECQGGKPFHPIFILLFSTCRSHLSSPLTFIFNPKIATTIRTVRLASFASFVMLEPSVSLDVKEMPMKPVMALMISASSRLLPTLWFLLETKTFQHLHSLLASAREIATQMMIGTPNTAHSATMLHRVPHVLFLVPQCG